MSVQVAVITETVDPFNSSLVSPKEVFVLQPADNKVQDTLEKVVPLILYPKTFVLLNLSFEVMVTYSKVKNCRQDLLICTFQLLIQTLLLYLIYCRTST